MNSGELIYDMLQKMLDDVKGRDPIEAHKIASELVLASHDYAEKHDDLASILDLAMTYVIEGLPPLNLTSRVVGFPDLRVVQGDQT